MEAADTAAVEVTTEAAVTAAVEVTTEAAVTAAAECTVADAAMAVASAIASAAGAGAGREEIGCGVIGRQRSSSTIALPATITTISASAFCARQGTQSTSGAGVYRTSEELEP
jgi:hypothetical protein